MTKDKKTNPLFTEHNEEKPRVNVKRIRNKDELPKYQKENAIIISLSCLSNRYAELPIDSRQEFMLNMVAKCVEEGLELSGTLFWIGDKDARNYECLKKKVDDFAKLYAHYSDDKREDAIEIYSGYRYAAELRACKVSLGTETIGSFEMRVNNVRDVRSKFLEGEYSKMPELGLNEEEIFDIILLVYRNYCLNVGEWSMRKSDNLHRCFGDLHSAVLLTMYIVSIFKKAHNA